jgi:hypothetical protein
MVTRSLECLDTTDCHAAAAAAAYAVAAAGDADALLPKSLVPDTANHEKQLGGQLTLPEADMLCVQQLLKVCPSPGAGTCP